jgi:hypothetical protein
LIGWRLVHFSLELWLILIILSSLRGCSILPLFVAPKLLAPRPPREQLVAGLCLSCCPCRRRKLPPHAPSLRSSSPRYFLLRCASSHFCARHQLLPVCEPFDSESCPFSLRPSLTSGWRMDGGRQKRRICSGVQCESRGGDGEGTGRVVELEGDSDQRAGCSR